MVFKSRLKAPYKYKLKGRVIDMCKKNNSLEKKKGTSITVLVDVTKIVKYSCITAICIVGIIFGTRCYHKMLEEGFFEE